MATVDELLHRVEILENRLQELSHREQVLEDTREIEGLKIRFMEACDVPGERYNSQVIADMFTEDGILDEGPDIGVVLHGRKEIKEFYDKARAEWIKFGAHYLMNPVVEVKRDSATGRWYFFEPFTYAPTSEAYWCAARWEDEFLKVEGRWLIKKANFFLWFMSPFDQGWEKKRFPWEGKDEEVQQ